MKINEFKDKEGKRVSIFLLLENVRETVTEDGNNVVLFSFTDNCMSVEGEMLKKLANADYFELIGNVVEVKGKIARTEERGVYLSVTRVTDAPEGEIDSVDEEAPEEAAEVEAGYIPCVKDAFYDEMLRSFINGLASIHEKTFNPEAGKPVAVWEVLNEIKEYGKTADSDEIIVASVFYAIADYYTRRLNNISAKGGLTAGQTAIVLVYNVSKTLEKNENFELAKANRIQRLILQAENVMDIDTQALKCAEFFKQII